MASELGEIHDIPLEEIYIDNTFNCRGSLAPIDVVEFAKALDRDGLQNPIMLQPWKDPARPIFKYRVVAGHRRTLAFKINKKKTIPAIIRFNLSDLDARKVNLLENLHRKDLNIKQEAHALIPFRDAGWIEQDMAQQFEQSRGWVKVRLMLLDLPEDIQDVAAAKLISQEQIKILHGKPKEQQYVYIREVKEAKARGEKIKIEKPVKKVNPHKREERGRAAIFDMIDKLYQITGMGLHTRTLGWAAGEISEYELMRSVEIWCLENNIEYKIPAEMAAARLA